MDDSAREMTLREWVERLPEAHRARQEYAALARVEGERDKEKSRCTYY